jgi:Tfp pilus assembly protein PilX
MKNNNKGFGLVVAMLLVIVMTLLAFTILEYVIPF